MLWEINNHGTSFLLNAGYPIQMLAHISHNGTSAIKYSLNIAWMNAIRMSE